MKLMSSPLSPYGRKVKIAMAMKGAKDKIELVATDAVEQMEHGVLPVTRVPGRQIDVRFAPRAGDARVVLERFDTTGRDAGAPRVEARGSVGERPDIVGAEHDGPAHVAATLRGRRSLGLLLGRRCGSGDEEQDRGAEYVGSVFQSRREAKAIITPDELGVAEG